MKYECRDCRHFRHYGEVKIDEKFGVKSTNKHATFCRVDLKNGILKKVFFADKVCQNFKKDEYCSNCYWCEKHTTTRRSIFFTCNFIALDPKIIGPFDRCCNNFKNK